MTAYARAVLDAVDAIPPGTVMTYGDVAEWVGVGSARGVGAVLRTWGSEVPWHRVLAATGKPAPHLRDEQLALLRAEGVRHADGRVDLASARWSGS